MNLEIADRAIDDILDNVKDLSLTESQRKEIKQLFRAKLLMMMIKLLNRESSAGS